MQNEIDQKQLAGAVTILACHGKIIDYRTYGQRDMEKAVPMTKDTIFRAYSMTKPPTGVAMMILYEQGKWLPWHPISDYNSSILLRVRGLYCVFETKEQERRGAGQR